MIQDVYSIAYSSTINLASLDEIRVDLELQRTNKPPIEFVTIEGCVRDSTKPIPNAKVHLYDRHGNELCSVLTNHYGYYCMKRRLSIDIYKINVTHHNYKPSRTKNIKVNDSKVMHISFYLFRYRPSCSSCIKGKKNLHKIRRKRMLSMRKCPTSL